METRVMWAESASELLEDPEIIREDFNINYDDGDTVVYEIWQMIGTVTLSKTQKVIETVKPLVKKPAKKTSKK